MRLCHCDYQSVSLTADADEVFRIRTNIEVKEVLVDENWRSESWIPMASLSDCVLKREFPLWILVLTQ